MLLNLLPIKMPVNRKLIKITLEELLNNENITELLFEKIKKFLKDNSYRGINETRKEKVLV